MRVFLRCRGYCQRWPHVLNRAPILEQKDGFRGVHLEMRWDWTSMHCEIQTCGSDSTRKSIHQRIGGYNGTSICHLPCSRPGVCHHWVHADPCRLRRGHQTTSFDSLCRFHLLHHRRRHRSCGSSPPVISSCWRRRSYGLQAWCTREHDAHSSHSSNSWQQWRLLH